MKENVTVSCGTGPLDHPKIFLNLEKTGEAFCPYCSHHFTLKKESVLDSSS